MRMEEGREEEEAGGGSCWALCVQCSAVQCSAVQCSVCCCAGGERVLRRRTPVPAPTPTKHPTTTNNKQPANRQVKPVSKAASADCQMVNVETYGGGLWHTWFDRDLGAAGRALVRDGGRLAHR